MLRRASGRVGWSGRMVRVVRGRTRRTHDVVRLEGVRAHGHTGGAEIERAARRRAHCPCGLQPPYGGGAGRRERDEVGTAVVAGEGERVAHLVVHSTECVVSRES